MYMMTAHGRFVAYEDTSGLIQVNHEGEAQLVDLLDTGENKLLNSGPLSGYYLIHTDKGVQFKKDGKFLCAEPKKRTLAANRQQAHQWETFLLLEEPTFPVASSFGKSAEEEIKKLNKKIADLAANRQPVKLNFGCGPRPRAGFLNLDYRILARNFAVSNPDKYFIFPYADMPWGIPDNCVDYIFHEDFIEHVTQLQQIQFLAEALRVLKPGCYHRVNTPNIVAAMKRHSKFKDGFRGVYTGELAWGHVSIFSPMSLKETAELVGYREVVFTTKNHGVSPFAEDDWRPGPDRDEILGNIYADLLK